MILYCERVPMENVGYFDDIMNSEISIISEKYSQKTIYRRKKNNLGVVFFASLTLYKIYASFQRAKNSRYIQ